MMSSLQKTKAFVRRHLTLLLALSGLVGSAYVLLAPDSYDRSAPLDDVMTHAAHAAPITPAIQRVTARAEAAPPPVSLPPVAPPVGGRGQPVPVRVRQATIRDVPIYLEGLGTVQASAMVSVRPLIDGTLQEVRFREGQDVKVGDVLARLDPRTYQAALDQAVAKRAQDQASLSNARLDLGRYQKLATNAYISAQQADTAKSTVAQLTAQVAGDQAQIDNARAQLSYTIITAPVAGRTGIRQVDAGNIVHAADASGIVVITTLQPIDVVFTLPQQALRQVSDAMAAGTPEVLALPQSDDANAPALDRGTLAVLDNQVDASTGTIRLKAVFPNAHRQLWPGAFVTVRLRVDVQRGATVVPPLSVQRGPRGAYVYVVRSDHTVERREVHVGAEDQTETIIESGLSPGEQVVTDGASRLTDGTAVAVSEPAANAARLRRPGDT